MTGSRGEGTFLPVCCEIPSADRNVTPCSTFHRVRCPREGEYKGPRYSMAFFNQATRDAVIQGPDKAYPKIVGFFRSSLFCRAGPDFPFRARADGRRVHRPGDAAQL